MLRFEDLRVRDSDRIDRDFLNRRLRLIAESIVSLSGEIQSVTTDSDNLVTLGLTRVNEVLGPALLQVTAAVENGFLVATSSTALTLAAEMETTFAIKEGPERALFTPTPHVIITRKGGNVGDWAIFRVAEYNRENGGLAGEVIAISGDIGAAEYADWILSDSAGLAVSIIEAAANVANTLDLAQKAAVDAKLAADTATKVLAEGPVSSVNGQTGEVTFGISDIPGLTAQLGGKASSSHGHVISDISGLSAELDSKAALSHGHAIAGISGLSAELDGKAAASHGHEIADINGLTAALDSIDGGSY